MMALIYVTASNKEEAMKIGESIVKDRLAACSNVISDMKSVYWWEGSIDKENESILILKTLEKNIKPIIKKIKKIHSYDNPCIIALPVLNVSDSYLEWVKEEID